MVTDDNNCESILNLSVGDNNTSTFQNSFQGDWDDLCRAADNTASGGYALAGYTESYGAGGSDATLIATDINGNFQWSNTYGGTEDDGANAVINTTDGGFLLCGYTESYGAGGVDVYLIKTDGTGNVDWSTTYGGTGDDRGYAVIETTNGYVIAGGTESFGTGSTDVYLISIDNTGTLQWTKTFGGNEYDYGYDLQEVSTGGYIIAGYTYSYGAGGADMYVIKTDNTGSLDWTKAFGGAGDDIAWSVKEASSGGFVLAGHSTSYGGGDDDVLLIKIDAAGTPEWTKTYGDNGTDIAYDLETTTTGYVVAGYSNSFGSGSDDMYLFTTDNEGNLDWSSTYGGNFNDRGWDVVISPDNAYVIAGNSKSFGETISEGFWENYLVKTDEGGNTNCNQTQSNTVTTDTTSTLGFGGLEGSGGSETIVSLTSNAVSMVGDTLCFTTVGIINYYNQDFGSVSVYPNPNTGSFSVDISATNFKRTLSIRILDIQGKLLHETNTVGKNYSKVFGFSNIGPGMYFVQVITEEGTLSKKIICQ